MMNAMNHYDRLFGEFGLSPQDAAKWVFASGWNACIEEMLTRALKLHLDADTHLVLSDFLDKVRHVEESDLH